MKMEIGENVMNDELDDEKINKDLGDDKETTAKKMQEKKERKLCMTTSMMKKEHFKKEENKKKKKEKCDKLNDHEKEQLRKHKKEGKLYVIVLWVMKKKRLKKMI